MSFKKVNNLTGWAVFLIAMVTYMISREARGSFWDTGEFIATADKLGLPHPPGAPLFTILGRFFIILFGDKDMNAASAVNFMSALASAATILFLFWTVTHFARKMFVTSGEQLTGQQIFTTMAAGAVGALAYAFSDSFWFSAVEGEVYSLSSFFTALVFWAILKWEHADEQAGVDPVARLRSDRWIVFLFFMMGLSIGVHLLNLLTIPAIVMVYYYRRYTPTTKGSIFAFLIGCVVTGVVQVGIIQYSMKAAGLFDVFFVNSAGMSFFSGFAIYFLALGALIFWALRFSERKFKRTQLILWFVLFLLLSFLPFITTMGSGGAQVLKFLLVAGVGATVGYFLKPAGLRVLRLTLWCYIFMMLGYFMYFTALIRSNANPTIDMNNVDNPISLVNYLSREQYGSAPLLYGPHFAAEPDGIEEGEMRYVKGKDKYIAIGRQREYSYPSSEKQLFPRVWDASNDQNHAYFYSTWLNLPQDRQTGKYEAPTYGDNLNWFFTYQMGLMYWRYFMWNFAGKQNDVQGMGNVRDGNWISGISMVDNNRLGDQSKLPDSLKNNKANNKLYMLPFILGIVGCIYQFMKRKSDWIVSFLLFFFTGIAIVLYLNQPGNQPRERDYAFVGSFFAFAIWIGLSVVAFVRMAKEKADKVGFTNLLIYGSSLTFVITVMSSLRGNFGSVFMTGVFITVLFAVVTMAITFLLRAISSAGQNMRALNIGALVICMIVPILMAQQEWDDHDRSEKTLAPDLARNYLESCAPNAILFSFGDNDTYPLWYAQEVEGIRPDVRLVNYSLLGIDWYINQLRYKVNQADSLDVIWSPEQMLGGKRDFVVYSPKPNIPDNRYYDLYDLMKNYIGSDDPSRMDMSRGEPLNSFPIRKVSVPVNRELAVKNQIIGVGDSVLPRLEFELPQKSLLKNELALLNIIAANSWKRPIYFTSPFGELGFAHFLRKDGLTYQLVPAATESPKANWVMEQTMMQIEQAYRTNLGGPPLLANNTDAMFKNLSSFKFGGAANPGIYFDEENRRHLLNIRAVFAEAVGNLADEGKKQEALKLLEHVENGINPKSLPYGMTSRFNSHNQTGILYLEAAYKAGRMDLAEKIRVGVRKDLEDQRKYYDYLKNERPEFYGGTLEGTEVLLNEVMLQVLEAIEKHYVPQKPNTTEQPQTITTPNRDTLKP
jgi:hypothetical protein